jgi:hypothetical protein
MRHNISPANVRSQPAQVAVIYARSKQDLERRRHERGETAACGLAFSSRSVIIDLRAVRHNAAGLVGYDGGRRSWQDDAKLR